MSDVVLPSATNTQTLPNVTRTYSSKKLTITASTSGPYASVSNDGDVLLVKFTAEIGGLISNVTFTTTYQAQANNSAELTYLNKEGEYVPFQSTGITRLNVTGQTVEILVYYDLEENATLAVNEVTLVGDFYFDRLDEVRAIDRQLFPLGWAFKSQTEGVREKLFYALGLSTNRVLSDLRLIQESILPDNEYFTIEEASDWELRLSLPSTGDLDTRKKRIKRKLAFPGNSVNRQNWRFLESQLQEAGFDVYVHENRFLNGSTYETKSYQQFTALGNQNAIYSTSLSYGAVTYGQSNTVQVVGSEENVTDASFDVKQNYGRTFFIGGSTAGTFASVDAAREKEFRRAIMQIKPLQTVAYLLINFS